MDKLGSIRPLAEGDGTWKYSTSYGPYGEPKTSAGTDPGLRYRWTGREYDPETGWYFHRTRYYAPTMLRFVQEDKIGYDGGANLYAYVAGAVLDARDPSGMFVLYDWLTDPEANCYSIAFCLGIDGTPLGGGGTVGEHRSANLQAWAQAGWDSFEATWNDPETVITLADGTEITTDRIIFQEDASALVLECARSSPVCSSQILALVAEPRFSTVYRTVASGALNKFANFRPNPGLYHTTFLYDDFSAPAHLILLDPTMLRALGGERVTMTDVIIHENYHALHDGLSQLPETLAAQTYTLLVRFLEVDMMGLRR